VRPAARLQAAIELLAQVLAGARPADVVVADYFRQRRYAGSADRRAVQEMLYAALRARGLVAWGLGEAVAAEPRMLALGWRVGVLGEPPDELARLCDGGGHGPDPLTAVERARLQRLAEPVAGPPPAWARANLPPWLHALFVERFGAAAEAECAALLERAPFDLRVNRLKADRAAVLARLAADGIAAAPGRFSPDAVRLAAPLRLESHPLWRDGTLEVQDEGSQLVALLLGAQPGERVLDLCAGAGGKALALAAATGDAGLVVASDADPRRLAQASPRLARAGARSVRLLAAAGDGSEDAALGGPFDRVLVDAPCSGTGTWRRRPEASWRLAPEELVRLLAVQAALLDRAADLVRPGGLVVYAVCSLLRAEGEAALDGLFARRPEMQPIDPAAAWMAAVGAGAPPLAGPGLLLTPARHGTDGFFVGLARRAETGTGRCTGS